MANQKNTGSKIAYSIFSFLFFFFNLGKASTFLRFCFLTCKTGKIILCLRLFIVSLNSSSSVIRGDLTFAGFSAAQNKIYSPETLLHLTWDEWDVNTIKLLARNFLKTSDRHLCLPSYFLRPSTQTANNMLDLPSWTLEEKRPHLQGTRNMGGKATHLVGFWEAESRQRLSFSPLRIFGSRKYCPLLFQSLLFCVSVTFPELNTNDCPCRICKIWKRKVPCTVSGIDLVANLSSCSALFFLIWIIFACPIKWPWKVLRSWCWLVNIFIS